MPNLLLYCVTVFNYYVEEIIKSENSYSLTLLILMIVFVDFISCFLCGRWMVILLYDV